MKMERNSVGEITIDNNDGSVVSATIPRDRSALGVIATNGLINGAEYREDFWAYVNGQRVRKWHSHFAGIRIWEPKFDDLNTLYRIYKKTHAADSAAWHAIREVLNALWETRREDQREVIAHAKPTHHFQWQSWKKEAWWAFNVSNGEYGLSFGFNWLEGKPKKLVNHKLGEKLYYLERRWYNNTCSRLSKVKTIFFEAMKRSLPKVNEDRVICLKFGEDTFWFYTVNKAPNYYCWEMFKNSYKFEIKKIV